MNSTRTSSAALSGRSPRRVVALGLLVTSALFGWACGPRADPALPSADVFPDHARAYNVQMHVHGHSHHNGDRKPGSMQWHSYFADLYDFDVLWWSDHSEMFDLRMPLEIDYTGAASAGEMTESERRQSGHRAHGGEGLTIALVDAPQADVDWIERQGRKLPGRTNLVVRGPTSGQAYSEVTYAVLGPSGRPRGFLLPRPVSSGATLAVDFRAWGTSADVRLEVVVGLSWHHRGAARRQQLRYQLSGGPKAGRRVVGNRSTVLSKVPISPERQRVVLDLQRTASLLPDGEDNTITSVEFHLSARRGARASLEVFGLELSSRTPEPDHQLAQIRRFSSRYEAEYGHAQHVGVEFLSNDGGAVHLNAFLPGSELNGTLASGTESTWADPAEFVRQVHAAGGLVSLNHMFGTTVGTAKPPWQGTLSKRKAAELLRKQAYGVDLLEVGYSERGGVGLDFHLRTWDALTAHGLSVYGNGVSDTHGSEWGPGMRPNRFSTWVWSAGTNPGQLLTAMRAGRMVFGDPFAYSGHFYFRVGDAEMGDRVPVRNEPQTLRVGLDEHFDPDRHQLFLVQGWIRPENPEVAYASESPETGHRRELRLDEPIRLDVSRPSFVRLELHGRDGQPLLFTNPIVFDGERERE